MKKEIKRWISLALTLVMSISLAVSAFAVGNTSATEEPLDFGEPTREITYYDEELEATVTERSYFIPGDLEESADSAAADNETAELEEPIDFGEPIREITYYDEELEATVTERSYFVPDNPESSIMPLNCTGGGTFKEEKQFEWSGSQKTTTVYAQGYFKWKDGNVSVSKEAGGYDYFPSNPSQLGVEITEEGLTTGNDVYGFWEAKNYAFVKYIFKFKHSGTEKDLTVIVRVDQDGKKF